MILTSRIGYIYGIEEVIIVFQVESCFGNRLVRNSWTGSKIFVEEIVRKFIAIVFIK